MQQPEPEDWEAVQEGAKLQVVMPIMEQEIGRMIRVAEQRTFREIEAGTLTPEAALEAWREIHSYQRLLKRLQGRIYAGQSIGEELKPWLDIDSDDDTA